MNAVQLVEVTKKFGDKVVLDNVNLEIKQGEFVAITGKSGKGKTTMLNLMGMFEKADAGKVLLFGETFSKYNMNRLLREKISYVFQNFALIDNESIEANLSVALAYSKLSKAEKKKEILNALKQVGIGEMPLSQKIYRLSGGEQQRVALARLLLKPSELILADEPTGSLDEENRNAVLAILEKLNKLGKTIVIVTHDPYVAGRCGHVIEL